MVLPQFISASLDRVLESCEAAHVGTLFHLTGPGGRVALIAGQQVFEVQNGFDTNLISERGVNLDLTSDAFPFGFAGSVGGGLTFKLTPKLYMRTEFRDFITAFPKELIAPAPNAKYGSLLHDFVPMVGMDYVF